MSSVFVEEYNPFASTSEDVSKKKSARALELLRNLQSAGCFAMLDELPEADGWNPREYVPDDAAKKPYPSILVDARVAVRLNNSKMRLALHTREIGELEKSMCAALALQSCFDQGPFLIDRLVANMSRDTLLRVVVQAVDQKPDGLMLEQLDRAFNADSREAIGNVFSRERLFMLNSISNHFSDAARVERGLKDKAVEEISGISAALGSTQATASRRLGTYTENIAAVNRVVDDAISATKLMPWSERRYMRDESADGGLIFVETFFSVLSSLSYDDRAILRERACRTLLKIERFRLQRGRLPTSAEYTDLVRNDPDAIDPFSALIAASA